VTINLGNLPSQLVLPNGLGQIARGTYDGVNTWNNTVPAQPMQDGNGQQMKVQITPQRAGWWVVHAESIWQTPDAVWTYWHWGIYLTPADAYGWYDDRNHICVHSAIGWSEQTITTAFRLNAGIAYTAYIWWPNSTKGWNQSWWGGKDYFYIKGEFYEDHE